MRRALGAWRRNLVRPLTAELLLVVGGGGLDAGRCRRRGRRSASRLLLMTSFRPPPRFDRVEPPADGGGRARGRPPRTRCRGRDVAAGRAEVPPTWIGRGPQAPPIRQAPARTRAVRSPAQASGRSVRRARKQRAPPPSRRSPAPAPGSWS